MPVPRKVTKNVANIVLDYIDLKKADEMFKRLASVSGTNGNVRMFFEESLVDIEKIGKKRQKVNC